MAQIRFLKKDEPSQKKDYVPKSRKFKRYLIASGVLNVLFIITFVLLFIHIHGK